VVKNTAPGRRDPRVSSVVRALGDPHFHGTSPGGWGRPVGKRPGCEAVRARALSSGTPSKTAMFFESPRGRPVILSSQWQQEMRDKFCLDFDQVDRQRTHAIRPRLGLDSNPWRVFPRIVTSYDCLKQGILEAFRANCHVPEGSPRLLGPAHRRRGTQSGDRAALICSKIGAIKASSELQERAGAELREEAPRPSHWNHWGESIEAPHHRHAPTSRH